MSDAPPLRRIAVIQPMVPSRPMIGVIGTGITPITRQRSTSFAPGLAAASPLTSRITRRALGFGSHLSSLGGHHEWATEPIGLDLRRRRTAPSLLDGPSGFAYRWPIWSAPPAIAIPQRHQSFIGRAVLPDSGSIHFDPPAWFADASTPLDTVPDAISSPATTPLGLPLTGQLERAEAYVFVPNLFGGHPSAASLTGDESTTTQPAYRPLSLGLAGTRPPVTVARPTAESGLAISRLANRVIAMRSTDDSAVSPSLLANSGTAPFTSSFSAPLLGLMSEPFSPRTERFTEAASDLLSRSWSFPGSDDSPSQPSTSRVRLTAPSYPLSPLPLAIPPAPPVNFARERLQRATWQPHGAYAPIEPDRHDLTDGAASSSQAAAAARTMQLTPFVASLASPLPPSTLSAPETAPMKRVIAPALPAPMGQSAELTPRFVAERLTSATRLLARSLETAAAGGTMSPLPSDAGATPWDSLGSAMAIAGLPLAPISRATLSFDGTPSPLPAHPPTPLASMARRNDAPSTVADEALSLSPSPGPPLLTGLPVVLRRATFGERTTRQAAAGPISPVWGSLGHQVQPLSPSTPAASEAVPASGGVPLPALRRNADSAALTQSLTLATAPNLPLASASALGGTFGAIGAPVARSVMAAPTASQIMYRSALVDRAEPGAAHQAEAAALLSTSSGAPLPPLVRRSMEQQFGLDLSPVRIHSGPGVMRAADLVAARAMARGDDVFLPGGMPEHPASEGMPLLAHELTHVVQHRTGRATSIATPPPVVQRSLTLARRTSDHESDAERQERSQAAGLDLVTTTRAAETMPAPALTLMRTAPTPVQRETTVAPAADTPPVTGTVSVAPPSPDAAAATADAAQLAEQVYSLLERRLLVERERGGYRR